jgi:HAD superfamily hydrolase (TIGR01549 family)
MLPKMWGLIRVSIGTDVEMQTFLNCLDQFKESRALIFDLDDTLVDTSKSYDATVAELVLQFSGQPLQSDELKHLRMEGGFNDDWDAALHLIQKRGAKASREEIEKTGKKIYLSKAKAVETPLADLEQLETLKRRHRLMVITGRPRDEYTPVWEERLAPYFEHVYCQDDFDNVRRKPEPDLLLAAMKQSGIEGGIYVGNSVDDMQAALKADLIPVGVTTTQDGERLSDFGASCIIQSVNDIGKVLLS